MDNIALVSIIIPLYNGSNYVKEAIGSALAQTYKNIEIIVVNDGSTDNGASRQAVLEYGDKIRYFEKENGGCASALNFGIRQANGEFISWLSHDDIYYPNKVELEVECYQKYNLSKENCIISGRGDIIDSNGNKKFHPDLGRNGLHSPIDSFNTLLFSYVFNGCGLLIPKKIFDSGFSFNESQKFVLDWNLWLRLALSGYEFYVLSNNVIANRVHSSQVTVTHAHLLKKEKEETIFELFEFAKNKEEKYMKSLCLFACQNSSEHFDVIYKYLKENKIRISRLKLFWYKVKIIIKNIVKKIYKKVFGIRKQK